MCQESDENERLETNGVTTYDVSVSGAITNFHDIIDTIKFEIFPIKKL